MTGAPPPDQSLPHPPDDPEATPEADLWFLPGPAEPAEELLPWPVAPREPVGEAGSWRAAERRGAVALARAAGAFGALDARLALAGEGAVRRLALQQVADLSWHLDARLSEDRIALYLALRSRRSGDDAAACSRAAWSFRRLGEGPDPEAADLAGFLGRRPRPDVAADDLVERPTGAEFAALEARFRDGMAALSTAHPITRAAWAWHLWRRLDLSGEAARIEGAVAAARIGAAAGRGGAPFLPVPAAWRGVPEGGLDSGLAGFYAGVETNALRGLMLLDRIAAWRGRADRQAAGLGGRTPGRLIAALADWPMLSAEALAGITGASRVTVQRSLDPLAARGLVREVTGQGRFRLWAARA